MSRAASRDLSAVRLGRVAHEPARLDHLRRYAAPAPPPPVLDRPASWTPLLGRNDIYPDCVYVGLANSVRAAYRLAYDVDPVISEPRIWADYAACAGCADTDAAIKGTYGVRILDALLRAAANGLDLGDGVVPAFSVVDPADRMALASAAATRGSVLAGIDLYAEDLAPGAMFAAAPVGTMAGGHCVIAGWVYAGLGDADMLTASLWGEWVPVTWTWLQSRLQEAYAVKWL
jgi:hypothetical protein